MNVDKFGRSKSGPALKGPKGDGFHLTAEGDYDIILKRLKNVNDPKDELDVVNLRTLEQKCLIDSQGVLDGKGKVITNVSNPLSAQDAATKGYVDSTTPELGTHHWNLFHKRLSNCSNPIEEGDVVNLRYFQNNSPKVDMADGSWSFSRYRLTSIAKPLQMDDAVNRQYYKEGLADLSYALYRLFRGRARTAPITPSDWKAKVMQSTPWEDLFK